MSKFRVKSTLLVECEIDLIVEADNAEAADEIAAGLTPSNIGTDYREAGWKASVEVKPPKGVEVVKRKAKTTWIDTASGKWGSKPKKLKEPLA